MIRLSPSMTLSSTRIKDKHYKIRNIANPDEINFVKLLPDKLDFSPGRDFFFLNDDLVAVPLIDVECYAIVRTEDGSILCQFNAQNCEFVFNTTLTKTFNQFRAPDDVP